MKPTEIESEIFDSKDESYFLSLAWNLYDDEFFEKKKKEKKWMTLKPK